MIVLSNVLFAFVNLLREKERERFEFLTQGLMQLGGTTLEIMDRLIYGVDVYLRDFTDVFNRCLLIYKIL